MDKIKHVKFETLYFEPSRNGIYKKKEFHGRGQKIINMGELFGYNFLSSQDMKRIELTEKEKSNYLVQTGDLLFARRSLVLEGSGKCSIIINPDEDTTFESSIIRVRLDQNKVNPLFYFYLFKSEIGRNIILSIASQTAVSGIRGSELAKISIPNPSLSYQNSVVNLLFKYDKLMKKNQNRIELLENISKLIYEEWFVKFRFPNHKVTKFVDNQLGRIPEGWKIGKLGDKLEIKRGKVITKATIKEGTIPVVAAGINPAYYHNTSNANSPVVTISASGANAGYINLHFEPIWASDCSFFNKEITKYVFFYYSLMQNKQIEITALQRGSAQPHVYAKDLMDLQVVIPSEELVKEYEKLSSKFFTEISILKKKNKFLQETRDMLLPKLINGDIDVSELDIAVPEVEI